MKRILIHLLLLANLYSGLAFAWDTHPEALAGHDVVLVDGVADDDPDHPDGVRHHDDHCCHGAIHLVGILYDTVVLYAQGDREHFLALISALPFLYLTPLLRPPIV